jgi:hypothetical protein
MTHQLYFEKVHKEYAEASIEFLATETNESRIKFEAASKVYFEYWALLYRGDIDMASEYLGDNSSEG